MNIFILHARTKMSVPILYIKKSCPYCDLLLDIIAQVHGMRPDLGVMRWNIQDEGPYPKMVTLVPSIYHPASQQLYTAIKPCTRYVLSLLNDLPSPRVSQPLTQRYKTADAASSRMTPAPMTTTTNAPMKAEVSMPFDRDANLDDPVKVKRDISDKLFQGVTCKFNQF